MDSVCEHVFYHVALSLDVDNQDCIATSALCPVLNVCQGILFLVTCVKSLSERLMKKGVLLGAAQHKGSDIITVCMVMVLWMCIPKGMHQCWR
jgi:hypothetical protein